MPLCSEKRALSTSQNQPLVFAVGWGRTSIPGSAVSVGAHECKPCTSHRGEMIMSLTDRVTMIMSLALTHGSSVFGFPEGRAFLAAFISSQRHVWHAGPVGWFPALTGLSHSKCADNTWHPNKTHALLSNLWASFFKCYMYWRLISQKLGLPKTTSQLGEVSGEIFLKFWASSVSEVQSLWEAVCTEDFVVHGEDAELLKYSQKTKQSVCSRLGDTSLLLTPQIFIETWEGKITWLHN